MASGEKVNDQYYLSGVIKLLLQQGEDFSMKLVRHECFRLRLIAYFDYVLEWIFRC